jgi:hypothetical protein
VTTSPLRANHTVQRTEARDARPRPLTVIVRRTRVWSGTPR